MDCYPIKRGGGGGGGGVESNYTFIARVNRNEVIFNKPTILFVVRFHY